MVSVLDQSRLPVPGASVEVKLEDEMVATASTDPDGRVVVPGLNPGRYVVNVRKEGFETATAKGFECVSGLPKTIELMLRPASSKESIEVHDTASPVEATSAPETAISGNAAKDTPSRPATVSDALPLIPGIARQPGGALQLSGSGEHRSGMLVNSADVTDPVTGAFGLTIPMDRVESLNYYQTSFLAEFGHFTAGLVSVETKRGGEQWKWELNDPLPEFNIRSWHMRGLRTATPRLNVEGPVIPRKLYLSEGFEYEMRKTPVFTLPFPFNETKVEGFNSFTQVDWVPSDKTLVTGTLHVAPQRSGFVNLNYFNPQPTTPDAGTHSYTGTLSDKWSVFGGVWENTISVTRFDAAVWPKGVSDYVVQPHVNSGNYFAEQNRDARRYGWSSSFAFGRWKRWGTHDFKAGTYIASSRDAGYIAEHPISIKDVSGHLLERIQFTRGASLRNSDTEAAFFGQDRWIFNPRLSADLGLRMEYQHISESIRLGPRAGLVWNPFPKYGTAIRAGVGVFYDRVPLGVYSFERYPQRIVTRYDATGAVTAGPITYVNGLGTVISHKRFIYTREVTGNFSPNSTTSSLYVEQPITGNVRLRAGYLQTVSNDLVILDSTAVNPATHTAMTLLSGTGTGRYRQFDVTARLHSGEKRELMLSYVRSRTTGDLNDFASYIGSFPGAIVRPNRVATLATDLPNRFLAWGSLALAHGFGLAPVFEYRSGLPYSVVDARQRYVGIPNEKRFPTFLSVDARLWRDFKVNANYSVRLSVSGFNLTNHFNPEATHWNTDDPAHGLFFGARHRRFTVDFDVLF